MKHIVVLNPKGGCGKTTIATHLAVYASTLGLRVAIADHDKQASSHDWLKCRPRRCADIGVIAAYDGEAIAGDYDVIVHDMPASSMSEHMGIASACNKIVIPIMPSPIDIKAAMRLWVKLSNSGWLDDPNIEIGIVANRIKANTRYVKTLEAFIEKIGLPIITTLRDTQNYIRSLDAGLTLFDLPPNRVAADLVQWQPLMEWTGFFDIEDDELLELFGEATGAEPTELVSFEDMQAEQLADEAAAADH
ncbi:MAG: ParA family protein [Gammaproteobacteria bacterium]|nr:ParA family protein [Gammaproteobacteria bacterium]NND38443.1 AAA family ATPase [Pseudomonadales bacterium]MBT8151374.1 ParA family protein [Gammaproteobacteria bacterium]NNL11515.1 AAA family ATPase [Pseudomonadales bacterium]NNM11058.1 AAA family ATPase [Pseudomonadales bacterium]